ncbi:unnamed protein product [Orchesella dallaii]|uniref:Uncharacterized protein n=1 Tax=Orchesella dallaii TaxID=48710 RepID=A0ABP1RYT8_9HEXA
MSYPQQQFPQAAPQTQLSSTPSQVQPGVYYPAVPATVSYPQYTGPPPQFAGGVGQVGGFTRTDRKFAIAGVSCMTIVIVVFCLLFLIIPIVIFFVFFQKFDDATKHHGHHGHPDKDFENFFNRTPSPWG